MGPRILTYKGDVTHLMGGQFVAPRLQVGGGLTMVRWVVTDVNYYPEWNKTFVELDANV